MMGDGNGLYYGGANEDDIAVFITWGRTSIAISQDEAIQVFSRLLDAQIKKIKERFSE